jgi:cytochrome c-type biogenesis protein CcmH/NrfG
MEALDRYTFEQWQVAHSEFLEVKFAAVCSKIDGLKAQRLEDCEQCEKHRKECQGRLKVQIEEIKDNSKRTTKLLAAGIVLSVLVCLTATGTIPVIYMLKAIGGLFVGAF